MGRLEIVYRICRMRIWFESDVGQCLSDYFSESLHGILFTLIVSDDAELQLLFQSEVVVVVHFSCHKGIGLLVDCFLCEKCAAAST